MSPLSMVLTIVVIVLVFMLLRYLMSDPNTLQDLQDGKTTSTIDATSLATNGQMLLLVILLILVGFILTIGIIAMVNQK